MTSQNNFSSKELGMDGELRTKMIRLRHSHIVRQKVKYYFQERTLICEIETVKR